MAKRKTNYTSYMRTKPPTKQMPKLSTVEKVISNVEKPKTPVRTLKLTLSGGTRYTILATDDKYRYNDKFEILWAGLSKGDTVFLDCSGMKIVDAYIETSEKDYELMELNVSPKMVKLHLASCEEHICFECSKTDNIFLIDRENITTLEHVEESCFIVGCIVTVHWIGKRLAGFSL